MGHFGIHFEQGEGDEEGEWHSGDGKALRGTPDEQGNQKARIVTIVNQNSRETVAQCEMNSVKEGEITIMRTLLHGTGLEAAKITLDPLHLTPDTTSQIALAGGQYIIQAKRNQPILCDILAHVAQTRTPLATIQCCEKGHGRHEERFTFLFDLQSVSLDDRWNQSDISTLAVVIRQTISTKDPSKISQELSYYLSNSPLSGNNKVEPESIHNAIRGHWGVESVNWIRDVTFQEDKVKTKDPKLAQVLASIRTFSIRLLQKCKIPNFKAATEIFTDCPNLFLDFLHNAHVL